MGFGKEQLKFIEEQLAIIQPRIDLSVKKVSVLMSSEILNILDKIPTDEEGPYVYAEIVERAQRSYSEKIKTIKI